MYLVSQHQFFSDDEDRLVTKHKRKWVKWWHFLHVL